MNVLYIANGGNGLEYRAKGTIDSVAWDLRSALQDEIGQDMVHSVQTRLLLFGAVALTYIENDTPQALFLFGSHGEIPELEYSDTGSYIVSINAYGMQPKLFVNLPGPRGAIKTLFDNVPLDWRPQSVDEDFPYVTTITFRGGQKRIAFIGRTAPGVPQVKTVGVA